ncbi:calpain-5-like [Watersipora subatra]|uniref:calpain-5-like n=1 Tax=Watersipora subatra TaxID=2589382 RepID=UPI00355C3163
MGIERYKGQDYEKLRKTLLKSGKLFQDPEFSAIQKSLFHSQTDDEIIWKRPTDLCNLPKFIIDGTSADDLIEGDLGNRWFVAAVSNIANSPQLLQKVIPDASSQNFNNLSYTGMFRFRFWVFGRWMEIVIDDYLPTRHGKLIFCHSTSKNEFWSSLLEKAYAKMYGDYESLKMVQAVDVLVDMCGGVAERLDISEEDDQDNSASHIMFKAIEKALERNAFIVAEIREPQEPIEEVNVVSDYPEETNVLTLDPPVKDSIPSTGNSGQAPKTGFYRSGTIVRDGYAVDSGLLKSHGYNIREVKMIALDGTARQLLRVQSPWQTGVWRGAWSHNSSEMQKLSVKEKMKLGLQYESEAEFWMTISDFLSNYTNCDICHIVDTSILRRNTWNESLISGQWTQADFCDNRGGDMSHPSFFKNPQYMFDISDTVDGAAMFSLEQHDRTVQRVGRKEAKNLFIGFTLMKVEENRSFRIHKAGDIVATSSFTNDRSVFCKSVLPKGRYVVMPSTKEPRCEGEFLLRIYNSSSSTVRELSKDEPKKGSCSSGYSMAVQLIIEKAEGLTVDKGPLNPFCVVKCEGETQKTAVIKGAKSHVWNTKYIFYKATTAGHKKFPITLQVMNSKTVGSTCLGETTLKYFGDETGRTEELSLYRYSKKKDEPDLVLPGTLYVKVSSSSNLSEF